MTKFPDLKHEDCWVSFLGRVFDLTPLIGQNPGELSQPLADAAGKDISHWFDPKTQDIRRWINPVSGLEEYYTPMGRFVHIPPPEPSDDFVNDFDLPWWKDHLSREPQLWIGMLSQKTRRIRILNMLTKDEHTLEVCSEDTLEQIKDKYTVYNLHAGSYSWKRLARPGEARGDRAAGERGADMLVLDMAKTLEENGVKDETEEAEELGLDELECLPSLCLYFKDDLSVA